MHKQMNVLTLWSKDGNSNHSCLQLALYQLTLYVNANWFCLPNITYKRPVTDSMRQLIVVHNILYHFITMVAERGLVILW